MFGMAKVTDDTGTNAELCRPATGTTEYLCSTYSNYVTYTDAINDADKKYLFNQWHL